MAGGNAEKVNFAQAYICATLDLNFGSHALALSAEGDMGMSRLLKVALLLAGFVLPMTASLGGTTVGGGTNSPDVIRIKIPAAAPEGSTGTCKDGTYTMTEMQAKEC